MFALILIGFFTDLKLPGNIPVGLAALLVGTAIGWIGGYMSAPDVTAAAQDIAIALPDARTSACSSTGCPTSAPLLATAIPLGVYNFTEGMTNVESAAAAGDNYNLRSVLLADGAGAIVGSALGSPFPPAVYIGHPGWKAAGGRTGYSMATGVVIALLCFLGLFGLLGALLPAAGDRADPALHRAADRRAGVPGRARRRTRRRWSPRSSRTSRPGPTGLMDNALAAAGTSAGRGRRRRRWPSAGRGLPRPEDCSGEGAILAGLVLGAIVAFIIDKQLHRAAAIFCLVGAVLALHRADPRRAGRLERRRADRARLPVRRA